MIIHVMGASGSGTSTIGEFLGNALGFDVIESDFYKWEQTVPEFQIMRPIEESNALLMERINSSKNLVITGSLHSNPITHKHINLIIYLQCPTWIRIRRIKKRDVEVGRNSLEAEGEVKENFLWFLNFAKNYDKLGTDMRSKASQEMVIKSCNAPVIRIKTNRTMKHIEKILLKKLKHYVENDK